MALDRNEMARLHEEFLAELHGGRNTRGSGQTWQDPGDGRDNRLITDFAFAWDGKATRGKGITIDRAMIAKIREQAGGERPEIALRFYDTDDLQRVGEDWIAIPAADFAELLAAGRAAGQLTPVPMSVGGTWTPPDPRPGPHLPSSPPPPPMLRSPYPPDLPAPPHELWPCLVVDGRHVEGAAGPMTNRSYWITDDGVVTESGVSSVRFDRGMGEDRLYVNDVRVIRGELYIDGQLRLRVGGPQLTVS